MSTSRFDIVIVGGGVNGAAVAFQLAARGSRSVLLIERNALASGPTGASSAIIRQHYSHPTTTRMALDSLRFLERFHEITGGDAELKQVGALIGVGPADVEALSANVQMQRSVGVNTQVLTPGELASVEPEAVSDGLGAVAFEPESGYADPVGVTRGMGNWAREHGVTLWQHTSVRRVVVEAGIAAGVETERGPVAADAVVLAAGPWTPPLAGAAGTELPVQASRHPVGVLQRPPQRRSHRVFVDLSLGIYVRPEGADLTLVGSTEAPGALARADPDEFNARCELSEVASFGERFTRRYPSYRDAVARRGWAGIYDVTPDWYHIIDELPSARGCFVVCGSSGMGFKLGPAVGTIVAEMVLGERPTYDCGVFRLDRFAKGAASSARGRFAHAPIVG